jgi:hypothetical protein
LVFGLGDHGGFSAKRLAPGFRCPVPGVRYRGLLRRFAPMVAQAQRLMSGADVRKRKYRCPNLQGYCIWILVNWDRRTAR